MSWRFYILSVLTLFLFSCGGGEPAPKKEKKKVQKTQKVKQKKAPAQKKVKTKAYPFLEKKNLIPFLLDYGKKQKKNIVEVTSSFGTIKIRLYENTPLHRANFLYLCERNYFDLTQFYRVSKGFVCQAGNSDEDDAQKLRVKIGNYGIPKEMDNDNCHKFGAVAMARVYKNNPKKISSAFEWYIVLGEKYNKPTLRAIERQYDIKFDENQIKQYTTVGGVPYLDKEHTVFGEVIEGMDVVKKINKVNVDSREWPLTNIPIKAKILE